MFADRMFSFLIYNVSINFARIKKKKKVGLTNKNSSFKQSHEFFLFSLIHLLNPTVCMKDLDTNFFRVITWLISLTFTKTTYSFFLVLTSIIVNICSLFHVILKFVNRFIPSKIKNTWEVRCLIDQIEK